MTVITRLARAIAALLVVVAVVIGGAWALVRFGWMATLTSLDWASLWTSRDHGGVVLGIVTLIGWVAWGLATLSLVSEMVAVLTRQRWRLRLPGLDVFAPASTVLVTAIVGLVASQSVAPAAAHEAPPPPLAAGELAPVTNDHQLLVEVQAGRKVAEMRSHVVRPGDDLWSLAEEYLQDGSRWRELAEANQTVLLQPTDVLQPGVLLAIPDASPPPTASPTAQPGIVVRPGDTLSSLAAEHLGDARDWPRLAQANPDLITDPDVIDVGWVLAVPGEGSEHQRPAPEFLVGTPSAGFQPVAVCPAPEVSTSEDTAEVQRSAWQAALPSSFGTMLAAGLAGAYVLRRSQQLARRPLGRRLPALPESAAGTSAALAAARAETEAVPYAEPRPLTRVPLGEGAQGTIWWDLERNAVTWLQADDGDDVAMATAIALTLACAPEGEPVTVVTAGAAFSWLATLDEPRLIVLDDTAEALRLLDDTVAARRADRPSGHTIDQMRCDPELAEAWGPLVVILPSPPDQSLPAELGALGVSAVVCGDHASAGSPMTTIRVRAGHAEYLATGEIFEPHRVDVPARRVLSEVFNTANLTEYPSAPWWDDTPDAELPTVLRTGAQLGFVEELPMVSTIETDHPVLKLLGPIELAGAHGTAPSRAVRQCAEYCAWLLENPGASAMTMARALLVAEPTRRSNMSRLRSWLGADADGAAYLPDAYTGRITLHPAVSSDWEQLQSCISAGVNRVSDTALVEALRLVRGAPLADAAPGQWHWAEQLRADICATITDIAVVLGRRALDAGNLALAQWAVERAMVVAPDDELLLGVQIRIADARGDRAQVDRLVVQTTRRARTLGVDLADETVALLQEVVEGRTRLRRA